MEALNPGAAGDLPPLGELIVDVPFRPHPCASGPFDLSASAPPSRQVLSYRRTDPSVTRRPCAISLIVAPRANRPAAPAAAARQVSARPVAHTAYPVIRPQPVDVTTRALRVHLG